jgi:hypothetical protein
MRRARNVRVIQGGYAFIGVQFHAYVVLIPYLHPCVWFKNMNCVGKRISLRSVLREIIHTKYVTKGSN